MKGPRPIATMENDSNDHQNSIKKLASHEVATPVCIIRRSTSTKGTGIATSNL